MIGAPTEDELRAITNTDEDGDPNAVPLGKMRLAINPSVANDGGGHAQVYVPEGEPLPEGYRWF